MLVIQPGLGVMANPGMPVSFACFFAFAAATSSGAKPTGYSDLLFAHCFPLLSYLKDNMGN